MEYSELKKRKDDIESDSEFVKSIVDAIVKRYSLELDDFVELVRTNLQLIKQAQMAEYDDESLQMQIIKLPTLLYFAGNGLEDIGAESEIAAYKRKELYNATIESLDTSQYTIPDKKARAERATESEDMMEKIYDRAYKKLKGKIDHAIKLLESLKKVADMRIAKLNKGRGWDQGGGNGS
jgi:hypothetical protein